MVKWDEYVWKLSAQLSWLLFVSASCGGWGCLCPPVLSSAPHLSHVNLWWKMEMRQVLIESHMGRFESAPPAFTLHEHSSGQCYVILWNKVHVLRVRLILIQVVIISSVSNQPDCNSVEFLLHNLFQRLSVNEKMYIKHLWPDKPDIKIVQQLNDQWYVIQ